jgi:hypothetical protein
MFRSEADMCQREWLSLWGKAKRAACLKPFVIGLEPVAAIKFADPS